MRRILIAATAALTLTTWANTPTNHLQAATPTCADSNGSRPGGTVYVRFDRPVGCDVTPDQHLALTHTPTAAACDDAGGHGWTRRSHICWSVDF